MPHEQDKGEETFWYLPEYEFTPERKKYIFNIFTYIIYTNIYMYTHILDVYENEYTHTHTYYSTSKTKFLLSTS